MPDNRHPCPCCGYHTHEYPAGGSMQLCPICFWEDAAGEHPYNGSNQVSLAEAQSNFNAHGACELQYVETVRPPLAAEARSLEWLSIDGFRDKILELIEEAFAEVTLDDGVTLHQMDVIDDYGGAKEQLEARRKDREERWQDISQQKLSRFSGSMVFLDGKGFRFYLPALMRHALITSIPEIDRAEMDGVRFALEGGPQDNYYKDAIGLLSSPQLAAVSAFLYFFGKFGDSHTQRDALRGLEKGWDEWTPASVKLAAL